MSNWDLFNNWLTDIYQEAIQTQLRELCIDDNTGKPCQTSRFDMQSGKAITHLTDLRKVDSKEELQQYNNSAKDFSGPCPLCDGNHMYDKEFSFGMGQVHSRRLNTCPEFITKSSQERGRLIEMLKACWACTDWKHDPENCFRKSKANCDVKIGNTLCGGSHHKSLHGCGVTYCH